jgi:hypothetical protein
MDPGKLRKLMARVVRAAEALPTTVRIKFNTLGRDLLEV